MGLIGRCLSAPTERAALVLQLLCAAAVAILVCASGPFLSIGVCAGAALLLYLAFGPSRPMLALFLVFMVSSQEYRSFVVVPFGGVEWHPREFLLFLLLAHWVVKVLQGKARPSADIVHLFTAMILVFYLQIALVGLATQADIHLIISECRYPIFLLSYLVFVSLLKDRRDLDFFARLVLWTTVVIALASISYFVFAYATGVNKNIQNAFGTFVPRLAGSRIVMSVRPMGHMMYDICVVVLAGLLFCPATTRRRKIEYLAILALLFAGIGIMFMRTAYLSVAFSLMVLALMSLRPRVAIRLALGVGIFALAMFLFKDRIVAGLGVHKESLDISVQGRLVEMAGAWSMFLKHPILGNGMGSTFEALGLATKTSQVGYAAAEFQTVHNAWMYFLFKGGVIGMLLVVVGLGGILVRGLSIIPRIQDARDRCFLRGVVAAFAGQLFATLFMPRLTYPSGYVFIAIATSVIYVYGKRPSPQASALNQDGEHGNPAIERVRTLL
jgi:O-antigen ligase